MAEGTVEKTVAFAENQEADTGSGEGKVGQMTAGTVAECCGMYPAVENGWVERNPDRDHQVGRLSSTLVAAGE